MTCSIADEIAHRRRVHAGYAALPPLPGLIRGRFDPAAWAVDPDDRVDPRSSTSSTAVARSGADDVAATVTGFPGSAGVVEGTARVILVAADGAGCGPARCWSPTSPTWAGRRCSRGPPRWSPNVGAPLSHAAIVARELGIPAVVGCGTATEVIRDGDRVRVDGSAGVVQVLRP